VILYSHQAEIDPVPLYRASQVLMSMQLDTGEFPQQASFQSIVNSYNE
jgi:hypothetical protein